MRLDIPERGAGPTGLLARMRMRIRGLVGTVFARLPAPTPLRQAQRALPWCQLLAQAVATRLAYALLTFYFPVVTSGATLSRTPTPQAELIRRWTLWDRQWYIAISRRG